EDEPTPLLEPKPPLLVLDPPLPLVEPELLPPLLEPELVPLELPETTPELLAPELPPLPASFPMTGARVPPQPPAQASAYKTTPAAPTHQAKPLAFIARPLDRDLYLRRMAEPRRFRFEGPNTAAPGRVLAGRRRPVRAYRLVTPSSFRRARSR